MINETPRRCRVTPKGLGWFRQAIANFHYSWSDEAFLEELRVTDPTAYLNLAGRL